MTPEQPGAEIAGYRIESLIGRGGMAVVYRAEDLRLGRKVALKLLTPQLVDNEQFRQRFIKESRLAASLDHPNIVPIYEAGEADGQLFIAMRYVIGHDLKGLLVNEGGQLPGDRTLRLFHQIGDALDSAHRAGLVHRDVKPGNILVAGGHEHSGHASVDHVYLTDFGLTKRTSELSGGLTGTGHFLGTVDYVSPEQIQGRPVGPGTDIYALGCVLYECLTGRLPFRRDDDAALLWAHLVEAPPPVTGVRPDLPVAVNAVIARAMAKDPADRYATSEELLQELEIALGMPVTVFAPGGGSHQGGGGRHADTSDGPETGLGTVTGDVIGGDVAGGSQHPSFPSGPLPSLPAEESDSWETVAPAEDLPDDEEYGPYDEGDDADWEDEPVGAEPPAPNTRRRKIIIVSAVAVALVALAAAVLGWMLLKDDYVLRTENSTVVPFRAEMPADWGRRVGSASDVVWAPAPVRAADLFLNEGSGDPWASATDAVQSTAPESVWLHASGLITRPDTSSADAAEGALAPYLLDRTDLGAAPRSVTISGIPAEEFEGVSFDPANSDTRLRVLVDVVHSPGGETLVLAFYAPPSTFDDHLPTFEHIRDSVELGG
jgi:serine/threonine protein kinase